MIQSETFGQGGLVIDLSELNGQTDFWNISIYETG